MHIEVPFDSLYEGLVRLWIPINDAGYGGQYFSPDLSSGGKDLVLFLHWMDSGLRDRRCRFTQTHRGHKHLHHGQGCRKKQGRTGFQTEVGCPSSLDGNDNGAIMVKNPVLILSLQERQTPNR